MAALLTDEQMVDIVRPITDPKILAEVDGNAENRAIFTSEYHAIAQAQLDQDNRDFITLLDSEQVREKVAD